MIRQTRSSHASIVWRSSDDARMVAAWKADLRSLGDGYFFSLNRYVFRAIRD
jgi:hypothetical protein